jgi:hypothetical protein
MVEWAGNIECMGKKRTAFIILIGTPEGKGISERPRPNMRK